MLSGIEWQSLWGCFGGMPHSYAEADRQSMNSWIERLLDVEDMRRRCAAHEQWMTDHRDAVSFAEAWADRNLGELAGG